MKILSNMTVFNIDFFYQINVALMSITCFFQKTLKKNQPPNLGHNVLFKTIFIYIINSEYKNYIIASQHI